MAAIELGEHKRFAADWIERNRARFSDFNAQIWNLAEPAWREYRSAKLYCDLLRGEGFEVEEGSGGMPTAFAARWGSGGATVGSYAEYDAVPGNSQRWCRTGSRVPGCIRGPPAIPIRIPRSAPRRWPARSRRRRRWSTSACPARSASWASRPRRCAAPSPSMPPSGYLDGCDAFVVYHPNRLNTVAHETHCGSYWSAVFTFETPEPERWIDKGAAALARRPRRRTLPGRDRRALPDVHDDEIHQGGDVPAYRRHGR